MSMEQLSLFDSQETYHPLASRVRPETLEEFAGQEHLLGKGNVLRRLIENDQIPSMIFWGPPGVGKTTLAGIIAHKTHARLSARRGKDNAGTDHRRTNQSFFCRVQRGHQRDQGDQRSYGPGGIRPEDGSQDRGVCG